MFTSYKPKKFRNNNGCCICGTKSSSSRFTDSKKYEPDFEKCFQIVENRSGDICNACVLLVKRWRKLPKDTDRHWNHIVDSRAGPGKSAMKSKKKPCLLTQKDKSSDKPKDDFISKPSRSVIPEELSGSAKSVKRNLSSRNVSDSDDSDDMENGKIKYKKICTKKKKALDPQFNSCFRTSYWKKTKVCCGIIFVGRYGEVMVDTRFFKPCKPGHTKLSQEKEKANQTQPPEVTDSNSSSSKASSESDISSESTPDISNPSTSDIDRKRDIGFDGLENGDAKCNAFKECSFIETRNRPVFNCI